MNILIACEKSGVVREAFRSKGHVVFSCDVEPSDDNSEFHIQDDVLNVIDSSWDMMIAHPECTYLTVTGNKWMKPEFRDRFPNRPAQREAAVEFFMHMVNAPIHKICVENPVGIMSTRYQKPTQYIHPYFFGDNVPKKTGLWLKNLPKLVPTNMVEPEYHTTKSGKRVSKHYMTVGHSRNQKARSALRSKTFPGFAQAMADQWG